MASGSDPDLLTAALAEFNAVRTEIGSRSAAQHGLVVLNVAAIGTIGSVALRAKQDLPLLLVLPIVSTIIGGLYLDHARSIAGLGQYAKTCLHDVVFAAVPGAKGSGLFSWEKWVDKYRGNPVARLLYGVPLVASFLIGPIAAMILGLHGSSHAIVSRAAVAAWRDFDIVVLVGFAFALSQFLGNTCLWNKGLDRST